jgi:hypothetical protein
MPFKWLLFELGEVDCGFVIWYRAKKYNDSIENQLARAKANFEKFLKETADKGFDKIIIMSAALPTILDNQDFGEIATARAEVKATQLERTELTFRYNEQMKALCDECGFQFLDVSSVTIDASTGLIQSKFRNKDPLNHHLDDEAWSEVIIPQLNEILK